MSTFSFLQFVIIILIFYYVQEWEEQDMNFILRLAPVFIGWAIWQRTGNIIIGALCAVVLEPLIQGFIKGLAALFAKKQTVIPLSQLPAGGEGKGLRIFIGKSKKCTLSPEQIVMEAEEKLSGDTKYAAMRSLIYEGDLPVQAHLWEFDNPSAAERDKAISTWKGTGDIAQVGGNKIDDDHIFDYAEPNGSYVTAFLFAHDLKLPQTVETNE